MKKMLRAISAITAIAAAMVSFAGCGANNGGETANAIKIGGIGPITGAAAIYGQAVKNGAEIAVEERRHGIRIKVRR